jgi:ABC-type branched-subunit amino acid transport system substrate-binding protein
MQTKTKARRIVSFLAAALSASAATQPAHAAGVNDTEIRIGNIMPYTGQLAAFGSIGRAEAAYFDMINERGGINGRKNQVRLARRQLKSADGGGAHA